MKMIKNRINGVIYLFTAMFMMANTGNLFGARGSKALDNFHPSRLDSIKTSGIKNTANLKIDAYNTNLKALDDLTSEQTKLRKSHEDSESDLNDNKPWDDTDQRKDASLTKQIDELNRANPLLQKALSDAERTVHAAEIADLNAKHLQDLKDLQNKTTLSSDASSSLSTGSGTIANKAIPAKQTPVPMRSGSQGKKGQARSVDNMSKEDQPYKQITDKAGGEQLKPNRNDFPNGPDGDWAFKKAWETYDAKGIKENIQAKIYRNPNTMTKLKALAIATVAQGISIVTMWYMFSKLPADDRKEEEKKACESGTTAYPACLTKGYDVPMEYKQMQCFAKMVPTVICDRDGITWDELMNEADKEEYRLDCKNGDSNFMTCLEIGLTNTPDSKIKQQCLSGSIAIEKTKDPSGNIIDSEIECALVGVPSLDAVLRERCMQGQETDQSKCDALTPSVTLDQIQRLQMVKGTCLSGTHRFTECDTLKIPILIEDDPDGSKRLQVQKSQCESYVPGVPGLSPFVFDPRKLDDQAVCLADPIKVDIKKNTIDRCNNQTITDPVICGDPAIGVDVNAVKANIELKSTCASQGADITKCDAAGFGDLVPKSVRDADALNKKTQADNELAAKKADCTQYGSPSLAECKPILTDPIINTLCTNGVFAKKDCITIPDFKKQFTKRCLDGTEVNMDDCFDLLSVEMKQRKQECLDLKYTIAYCTTIFTDIQQQLSDKCDTEQTPDCIATFPGLGQDISTTAFVQEYCEDHPELNEKDCLSCAIAKLSLDPTNGFTVVPIDPTTICP